MDRATLKGGTQWDILQRCRKENSMDEKKDLTGTRDTAILRNWLKMRRNRMTGHLKREISRRAGYVIIIYRFSSLLYRRCFKRKQRLFCGDIDICSVGNRK